MTTYTIRSLTDFTPFTTKTPTPNPFRSTWADTLKLLGAELEHLDAKDVVFEVDCRPGDVRRDGMLMARAKVGFRGVRLVFDSRYGGLSYTCDTYEGRYTDDPADWQINVRAIALSLKALRAVDRYRTTKHGEQYMGSRAIGAGPSIVVGGGMTQTEACRILSDFSGVTVTPGESQQSLRARLRAARAATHPDRHNGDQGLWNTVEQAATALRLS